MEAWSTDVLAALVAKKHVCLTQLRELAGRQRELAADGDPGELFTIVSSKQRLIGLLQTIEQGLDQFRHEDPERRRWRTPAARAECAAQAAQCAGLLSDVVRLEQESEKLLTGRRDQAAHRLQGLHAACQARAAYAPVSGPAWHTFDATTSST